MNVRWLSFGLLLGLLASTAVSCGGAAKCSPANCPFGCCDASGTCQSTVSNAQCGTNAAACVQCPLGTSCNLGQCTNVTGGAGGAGGTGGGSGGGGGTSTGGGGGTSTGGGGGTATGGGSGSSPCPALGAANTAFFADGPTCAFELSGVGPVTINSNPNLTTQCTAALGQCSTNDRALLSSLASCIAAAPACASGNHNAAGNAYFSCMNGAVGLSSACQNAIKPATDGGASNTGGGAGGGTGGGGGCRTVSGFGFNTLASYQVGDFEFTAGSTENGSAQPLDNLSIEAIWSIGDAGTGLYVPDTYDLSTQGSYFACKACVTVCEGCQPGATNCSACYLARSGSVTILQATRGPSGFFEASVSNVRAESWNLRTDQPVAGGGCLLIPSASINTTLTVAP